MRIKNARDFPTALAFGKLSPSEPFLTFLVKGTFCLEQRSGPARAAREQLPVFTRDVPYDPKDPESLLELEADTAPFKPRADIVLVGSAHTPFGRPETSVDVQIRVGRTQKDIKVFGERRWSLASLRDPTPLVAGPTAFVEMPLTYDRAFGGIDRLAALDPAQPRFRPWCAQNFSGRGFIGARTLESIHDKPLPNIEDPRQLVRSWDSRPRPTGCGFFPRTSEPRSTYAGTYDEAWKKERAPELPADFRFDFWNGADPELQVQGYLAGNEPVSLTNVMPGGGTLTCFLPCLRPTLRVETQRPPAPSGQRQTAIQAVLPRLDTLVFLPDRRIFYLVWRGIVPIREPDASDVLEVRVDYETLEPALDARQHAPAGA